MRIAEVTANSNDAKRLLFHIYKGENLD